MPLYAHTPNGEVSRIASYWGKADENYARSPKWHPLAYHCLDVAAIGAVWWDASSAIRRILCAAFGEGEEEARAWTLFFIALHDLGKFDVRFQMKAPHTVQVAWPTLDPCSDLALFKSDVEAFDHGRWGYSWAAQEGQKWLADPSGQRLRAWLPWLAGVTGHHGEYPSGYIQPSDFAADHIIEHDRAARIEWVRMSSALFLSPAGLGLQKRPKDCVPSAQALLAGFCSVCDWIGSHTDVSPYAELQPDLDIPQYYAQRMVEIGKANWLTTFGLVNAPHRFDGLGCLLRASEPPRGVQVLVDGLPPEPGLTLVEAPTGSGKTEAALAHAWQLLDAGHADSIVFALPTQATANAMLERAEAFSALVWATGANVVLAHGKRTLSREFQRLIEIGRRQTTLEKEEAEAQCAEWLASSRKRVFLGQVGVGTVDQVLLSVLPVRHKFVRGFGLARSVLIVDEVHAYDAYMHGLLAEVLRRQKAAGGSAILLSATLPTVVRDKLFAAWSSEAPASSPYPVVWIANGGIVEAVEVPQGQRPEPREVAIECLRLPEAEPDDPLIGRIVAAAAAGARVAVVCNLVDSAQKIARRLRERAPCPVDIFHSRFRFADRQVKEASALSQYGRDAVRCGGRILVATQVVEQSLDLDFDWMVTHICPVDLLFQRLGRLQRHDRPRPAGFESPRCTALTVEGEDYGLHRLIYGNTRVLWRTQQLLEKPGPITFPGAYRQWIDAVYDREDWPGEPEQVCRDFDDWWVKQRAAVAEAEQWIGTPRRPFRDDDQRVSLKTRDGEMSLSVLAMRADGRLIDGSASSTAEAGRAWNLEMNTIPAPASWRGSLRECSQDEDGRFQLVLTQDGPDSWEGRQGSTRFRYTQAFGLERVAGQKGEEGAQNSERETAHG